MLKKYSSLAIIVFMFTACGGPSTPTFKNLELTKSTEFRYKNDFNNDVYLPKNKKICILNVNKDLQKVHKVLESFIQEKRGENIILLKNCVGTDFYLKLHKSENFYGQYFNALKLTIIQKKRKKVVSDYTIGSTSSKKVNLDNPIIMSDFSKVFLTRKRIFGN